ncbi:MFS transporter [Ophiocordyceps camponoti-floridani]|uniref:MFS transporter n=1 Tax=Ophiocordyceps camponoti-floridani TaxID=2030778 RepID=A0A8H4Q5T2_9HYPO|nr:MFS transporter [Ophiocordyceps camponoti-floridani]
MEPSTLEIVEDIICRGHFPDHKLRMPVVDGRCKDAAVQKTLAMIRSWSMSADMLIPLVVQVPYGIVADRYGRKTVLILAFVGCVLQTSWVILVLRLPDIFSVWSLLYGSAAYAIGGGGQMAAAMIWTIVTDITPISDRTTVFYQLQACYLLFAVLVNPLSAFLLSIDPWIGMWLGFGALIVSVASACLIPETLRLRQRNDETEHVSSARDGETPMTSKAAWFVEVGEAVRRDVGHVWHFVFASRSIVTIILAYGLYIPAKLGVRLNILQYMTRRFGWEWSTATYISTISNITSVIVLLFILPCISAILVKRHNYNTLGRDLLLSRVSSFLVVLGGFLLAFASTRWLFISSLVITSLGTGFTVLCRALLNALVEAHTVATVNTIMSMIETLVSLVGAPSLGWLLSRGLEVGGPWLGLSFLVSSALSALSFLAISFYRVPDEVPSTC